MATAIAGTSSPLARLQHSNFLNALPREIVCAILTYLDQQDYLTGMETCKAWKKLFTDHARHAWTSIQLYPHDIDDHRRDGCLGSHVKSVTFKGFDEEDTLYRVVKKIIGRGCTEIETLVFIECTSRNQTRFLAHLRRLAPSLTHLTMIEHNANIAFLRVFDVCPKLTHFTYKPSVEAYVDCNVYDQEPVVRNNDVLVREKYPSIVYLCMDTIIDKRLRLEPILKKCPNIRSFIGASFITYGEILNRSPRVSPLYHTAVVDLDKLFTWCPRISFLENNWFCSTHNSRRQCRKYNDNPEQTEGLQHLGVCETDGYGRNQIEYHLKKSQRSLEHVTLSQHTDDDGIGWSAIFCSICLDQLRTLRLRSICADVNSIVAMINHSPLLESLTLHDMQITIDSIAIQSLCIMDQLHTLELVEISLSDINSLVTILEHCPILEHLTINKTHLDRGPFMVDLLISTINSHSTQLKYLNIIDMRATDNSDDGEDAAAEVLDSSRYDPTHVLVTETIILQGMPMISYGILQSIAGIKPLRCLNVQLDEQACSGKENDLLLFAGMLAETAIEDLTLSYIRLVPDDVLAIFAELPRLTRLTMGGPQSIANESPTGPAHINGIGLLRLISTSRSLCNITISHMRMSEIADKDAYDMEDRVLEERDSNWAISGEKYIPNPTDEKDDLWRNFWLNEQALHLVEFQRDLKVRRYLY
ncbi:hypothetical protein BJV82DRAFT_669927 [Fennellomyces sp. T-0311]|nr:hypothetical protein BJV82DRAFT_669927 [Fennellomyces sp. T-0311]